MKVLDHEQGSKEWFAARAGLPTASNFDKLITTKGEPSKQAQKYMYQLAGEAITGTKEEGFQSDAMTRGIEMEGEARSLYSLATGLDVEEVGLCLMDGKVPAGASPDGLVGDDGLVEIKCPKLATHVEYMLADKMPTTYFQQVQGQLMVTDRDWCDFMSYYPAMPLFKVRVKRDDVFIEALKVELKKFNRELEAVVSKLKGE